MSERAAVILAAGQGTRMRSAKPKVMHEVGGRPMVDWSIALARALGCGRIVVVCNPAQDSLQAHVTAQLGEGAVAIQDTPLGTGHAVQAAAPALTGVEGDLVVLYGDTPLIPAEAIEALFDELAAGADVGVLGFEADRPGAYGRLITDASGDLEAIVEAREATPEQLSVRLCNSGVMAASVPRMLSLLGQVTNDNAKGEYYLTDIVGLARGQGGRCRAVRCAQADVLGVNARAELAMAEAAFQARARARAMEAGVTLVAPETVFFAHDTVLAADTVVEPHVVFGPGVRVTGPARIRAFSHLEGATVHAGCEVGPYARLRPGTVLGETVRVGNFVEVKAATLGSGAKANHLAYLGDADIGTGVNIGAGTIFCNYDGTDKHRTELGDGAFIGSNSALVAPVRIGAGAYVGSGSVITKDVPDDALAVARGRQVMKAGWAAARRQAVSADPGASAGDSSQTGPTQTEEEP